MTCGCIPIIDAKLAERNTRVMLPIMLGADQTARPMIVTDQIETGRGKKKAVGLFATFCPFCGVSYSAEAAMPAPSDQEPVVVIGKDWSLLWASPDSEALKAVVELGRYDTREQTELLRGELKQRGLQIVEVKP